MKQGSVDNSLCFVQNGIGSFPYVTLMSPLSESSCCPGVVAVSTTRLDEIWSHSLPLPGLNLHILILLSGSEVCKTWSPLVLFIFICTKHVQSLHFNMPLVMTPDGGSPNSVTPARPSCDARACATLTSDCKINAYEYITHCISAQFILLKLLSTILHKKTRFLLTGLSYIAVGVATEKDGHIVKSSNIQKNSM